MSTQRLSIIPGTWAIVRLPPEAPIPAWADQGSGFTAITRTADELSITCLQSAVPAGERSEGGWALLKLLGPFPLEQVGVLASVATPLAAAGVSIFAISTYDTDYVFVKAASLERACGILAAAGHDIVR